MARARSKRGLPNRTSGSRWKESNYRCSQERCLAFVSPAQASRLSSETLAGRTKGAHLEGPRRRTRGYTVVALRLDDTDSNFLQEMVRRAQGGGLRVLHVQCTVVCTHDTHHCSFQCPFDAWISFACARRGWSRGVVLPPIATSVDVAATQLLRGRFPNAALRVKGPFGRRGTAAHGRRGAARAGQRERERRKEKGARRPRARAGSATGALEREIESPAAQKSDGILG